MALSRRGRTRRVLLTMLAAFAVATPHSAVGLAAEDATVVAGDTVVVVPGATAPADDETQRFVTLWDARFRSGPAFQAYLDSDLAYDDGYNHLPPERQRELVDALVDHWRATDPAFAAHVDWNGVQQGEAEGPRPTGEQVRGIIRSIVFHKEAFKAALRQPADGVGPAPQAPSEPPAAPPDPQGEAAAAALAESTEAAASMPGLGALDALGDSPDQLPEKVVEAAPHDVTDRLPTTGDVVGVDLGELGETLQRLVAPVTTLARARATAPVATAYAPSGFGPQNLTYGICWQLPTTSETCPSTPYAVGLLTSVPGQSALVDVDGNVLPDLEISLTVDPLSTPGGLAATVRVRYLTAAAANARGVVRYLLPDTDKELRVGFDGRAAGLQPDQNVTVVIESLAGLSAGDARLRASVKHTGAPGAASVVLEAAVGGGSTPDHLATRTTFDQAPSTFTTRLAMRRTGQVTTLDVRTTHGSSTLPDVTVDARGRVGQEEGIGRVTLVDVPATVDVTTARDDSTKTTNVTYNATSSLTRTSAALFYVPDASTPTAFHVGAFSLENVPAQLSASLRNKEVSFTASAPGGELSAAYEEYASSQLVRSAAVHLSSTPTLVSTSVVSGTQRYVVDSGPNGIQLVEAGFQDTFERLSGGVTITGFPGHAELTMPTSTDPRIAWSASSAIPSVVASAVYGPWKAYLQVTNIPATMSFVPATGSLDVTATGGNGTSITAFLTNHHTYATSPFAGDNYVTATRLRLGSPIGSSGSTSLTLLSAAVHVKDIVKVRVVPGTTTTVELKAGGGAPLYAKFSNDDLVTRRRAFAEARLVSFPGAVHASIGATTTVAASGMTDLTAKVEYGPLVALAPLPTPHGVIVRRTLHQGAPLVRGRLWLTGLPTSVSFAPGSIYLNGIAPSQPTLVADIALLDDPANPLTAYVELSGIPVNTPHAIGVTWSTSPYLAGYRTKVTAMTTNGTFGALRATLGYGRYGASLATSALPSSMGATLTELEGSTKFEWAASAPIASVTAEAFARPVASSPWTARAKVTLTDVPAQLTLATGRDGGGAGPLLSYNASAPTLDATVIADGSLRAANATLGASLYFRLVNLASTVNVTKAGAGFQLSGSGRTPHLEVQVSAYLTYQKSASGQGNPQSWLRVPWWYEVKAEARLKNLTVLLTDVAAFTVTPGLASELAGDFGTFLLRWDALTVDLSAKGRVDVVLDVGINRCCSFTVLDVNLTTSADIDPEVRLYEPGWHDAFTAGVGAWCLRVDFVARFQPRPFHTTSFGSGVGLPGAPGTTRHYWATPTLRRGSAFWALVSDAATGAVVYPGSWANGRVRVGC